MKKDVAANGGSAYIFLQAVKSIVKKKAYRLNRFIPNRNQIY
ncbi:hypothetical protein [Arsenophonus nasoniae]|uniref:Uncharacterized protein n=1 Tax=Arsenophonus nasoniae TaxID=638 RepID=A0AA95GB40_9GAMM|nr:hypothetical protein [Arsenophonus nasoniae]WGL93890.1 hypothetical protein QE207_00680 [Arsenophonus nasoniae]